MNEEPSLGTIRVSPAVLRSVAALAAADVPGVVAVGKRRVPPRGQPPSNDLHDGVRVQMRGDSALVDIELTVDGSSNLVDVGRKVQSAVSDAIQFTVGCSVDAVNVRIQDVA